MQKITHDLNGNPIAYLNNPNLKSAGQPLGYEEWQIEELIKCSDDIIYFAEKYYKIVHQDHGLINIKLRDYQKISLKRFLDNRFNILKFPRQSGKSTVFEIFVCHYVLFNERKNVALLANKAAQAAELLMRIKLAYINLPLWMQQGVTKWNEGEVRLENGSRVSANSTSSDAIRGQAVSLLILDEVAFVPSNIFDSFWESIYPTISSSQTSRVILVSTPNGMNHFSEFWHKAKNKENAFIPTAIEWWDVPGYGCPGLTFPKFRATDEIHLYEKSTKTHMKLPFEDAVKKLKDNGNIYLNEDENYEFRYNKKLVELYGIDLKTDSEDDEFYTPIHNTWRKETIGNTSMRKFTQEFGGEFLASADSLIASEHLKRFEYRSGLPLHTLPIYSLLMGISGSLERCITLFELPKKGHTYILGMDPAKITETSAGDSLAMQILDITELPIVQAGVIDIPTGIHYTDVHEIAAILGRYYNEAWIFIENNDQVGLLVAENLRVVEEYENIYSQKPGTSGFRTDRGNRKSSCLRLKQLIEKGKLMLYDMRTIAQLSTFIRKKDKYQAEKGYKDDLVMALVHTLFFMTDPTMFGDFIEKIDQVGQITEKTYLKSQELERINLEEDHEYAPAPFEMNADYMSEYEQMSVDFLQELSK